MPVSTVVVFGKQWISRSTVFAASETLRSLMCSMVQKKSVLTVCSMRGMDISGSWSAPA